MSIISLEFFAFLILSFIVYYIFPKKYRWNVLLVTSVAFFLLSGEWYLIGYMLFGIFTTYIGTRLIDEKLKSEKAKKITLFVTIASIVLELSLLKYINFIPTTIKGFSEIFNIEFNFNTINLLAPLGISYYTLSLIGYTLDVYWTTSNAQKNIFKHALFTCYYPILISGPIVRYEYMKKELFEPKKFQMKNIIYGAQRIVYGLLKKMVIADQLALVVNTIFANYTYYSGIYIIFGVILYAIQIYADFSGCIDIVIGASKTYGINLPENFESPFFSRNLSEFWRRWHISLGTWGKDYIMYPLLKSSKFQKLGAFCKKKLGKKIGKKIPTILAILILWVIIGIWHGASYKYIFAAGIIPWIYLTVGELFGDILKNITQKLKIRTKENFSYRLFESIRTFCFMCFIWLFALAPTFKSGFEVVKNIFVKSSLDLRLELPQLPYANIFIACIVVTIVDYLKYKDIDVLEWFNKQGLIFRYVVIYGILYLVLIYGAYGAGYNPVDFIYGGF